MVTSKPTPRPTPITARGIGIRLPLPTFYSTDPTAVDVLVSNHGTLAMFTFGTLLPEGLPITCALR